MNNCRTIAKGLFASLLFFSFPMFGYDSLNANKRIAKSYSDSYSESHSRSRSQSDNHSKSDESGHECYMRGPRGYRGKKGDRGPRGEKGECGKRGPRGEHGERGDRGPRGDKGRYGERGHKGDRGRKGEKGERGDKGPRGHTGKQGAAGRTGKRGPRGYCGKEGERGHKGERGERGERGHRGEQGPQGIEGPTGPTGAPGGLFAAADFFALMPGDNAATVAPGAPIQFPQNGPITGSGVSRINASQFNLAAIGTYQIQFQVSVTEPGQLVVGLDSGSGVVEQAYTVVGRATGTSQITGMCLVTTTAANSIITIRNPAGESAPLTITPLAGGTNPVSAHLMIMRVN